MAKANSNKMSPITFLTSNKGKPILVIEDYVYRRNKVTSKVTYWICEVKTCKAGVHTDSNDQFVKLTGDHSHLPTPENLEIRKMKTVIKDRVKAETTSIGQIYDEELARAKLSKAALALASTAKEASEL
jgi:hypothetical protein